MTRARPPGLEDVTLRQHDDGDQLLDDDGVAYRVVHSATSDEYRLVREDVAVYEGRLDHPATTGAAAFSTLLAAVLLPVYIGYLLVDTSGGTLDLTTVYLAGVACFGVGVVFFNKLLYQTPIGDYIARFEEWYETKHLLAGRDYGGERA